MSQSSGKNHDAGASGPRLKPHDAKGQGGRYGMQHYSDEDRRGYGRAYQREREDTTRYDQSVHDPLKDGRLSREEEDQ
jgi:hypothetical protein